MERQQAFPSHWAVAMLSGAAEVAALAAFLTMIAFIARGLAP